MATPLRQLLTSLSFDDAARDAFLAEPEQYLADHGWADLDGADLHVASSALVGELPPTQAIDLHAALGAADPAVHDGGADYLGHLVEVVRHPADPAEPAVDEIGEIGEISDLDDLDEIDHVLGAEDPALDLDSAVEPDAVVEPDPAIDDGPDLDLDDGFGARTTGPESTAPGDDDHEPAGQDQPDPDIIDDLFTEASPSTFAPWSDPGAIDAELPGESDLFPDDPNSGATGESTDGPDDLDLDL